MGWFFCRRAFGILRLNNKHRFDVYNLHKSSIHQPSFLISARLISSHIPSPFENMIELRRDQAQKSVIIEVDSKESLPSLCDILNEYGTILKAYYYNVSSVREALLIEYENREAVDKLLKNCTHKGNEILPLHSRLLKFSSNKKTKVENQRNSEISISYDVKDSKLITNNLLQCKSVSNQLLSLYSQERIDDLHMRLRFLVCSLLENSLSCLFPSCRIFPFGSSINGFGSNSSDLDMILDFGHSEKERKVNNGIYFQMHIQDFSSRVTIQKLIDTLGDFLHLFSPCTSRVQRIPHARVPIIKFHHDLANIDCDLSLLNLTGFYMSELIYIFGQYDKRLYPLVFAIRKWAKVNGITQEVPGPWITNFTLSVLVIFFLQMRVPPILPSVQSLRELSENDDKRFTRNVNCTFQRDITKIPPTENAETLETLLFKFFEFYKTFDFDTHAISIVSGQYYKKPSSSHHLHIENPLERNLNISKNVSAKELERFRKDASQALVLLRKNTPVVDSNLGIVSLFGDYFVSKSESKIPVQNFKVTDLFDGEMKAGTGSEVLPLMKLSKREMTELKTKVSPGSKNYVVQGKQQRRKINVKMNELFKQW